MFRQIILSTVLVTTATLFADRTIPETPTELTARVELAFANADVEIAEIIAVPKGQRTFNNTIGALDDMMVRLDGAANMMAFMAYVHSDANIREAAQGAEQLWSDWSIDFGTNVELFNAVKA
jgi:Zn-dependent oligopeptidase